MDRDEGRRQIKESRRDGERDSQCKTSAKRKDSHTEQQERRGVHTTQDKDASETRSKSSGLLKNERKRDGTEMTMATRPRRCNCKKGEGERERGRGVIVDTARDREGTEEVASANAWRRLDQFGIALSASKRLQKTHITLTRSRAL